MAPAPKLLKYFLLSIWCICFCCLSFLYKILFVSIYVLKYLFVFILSLWYITVLNVCLCLWICVSDKYECVCVLFLYYLSVNHFPQLLIYQLSHLFTTFFMRFHKPCLAIDDRVVYMNLSSYLQHFWSKVFIYSCICTNNSWTEIYLKTTLQHLYLNISLVSKSVKSTFNENWDFNKNKLKNC